MKKIIFQVLLLSTLFGVLSQTTQLLLAQNEKTPNNIRGCVNITGSLNSILYERKIKNGRVRIWTLEEVELYADVREVKNGSKTVRTTTGWHILDNQENEVPISYNERNRNGKRQKLVYTQSTNPEGCFIVEQTNIQ